MTKDNTKEINNLTTNVAVILNKISNVETDVKDLKDAVNCNDNKYVGKKEFDLVNNEQNTRISKIEKLVFSAIGLALITLGKAILELVVSVKATQ